MTEYVFYKNSISIPDGSWNQFNASGGFSGNAKIGDLLFMRLKSDNQIHHVGLYIGSNQVVEANGFYGKVVCRSIQDFSKETKNNKYAGIRRLIVEKVKII